jgi:hypothetical protein
VEQELYAHYCDKNHRITRWHNWRDRRASEDKFVQKVLNSFTPLAARPAATVTAAAAAATTTTATAQPQQPPPPAPPPAAPRLIIAYGNGSGFHALCHSPPSPTTGLQRRFLAKAHQGVVVVINTPEDYTSSRCSRCGGEVVEDPKRKRLRKKEDGKEEWVPVWGIRRCNSVTCGGLHRWNRDHNAAINIRANLLHYLNNGTWPQQQHQDVDEPTTTTITAVGNLL